MNDRSVILPIFAVGLVGVALYAMYLNQGTLAATAVGAIAGVFSLSRPGDKQPAPNAQPPAQPGEQKGE